MDDAEHFVFRAEPVALTWNLVSNPFQKVNIYRDPSITKVSSKASLKWISSFFSQKKRISLQKDQMAGAKLF